VTDDPKGSYTYRFTAVNECNMCGASPGSFRILGRRLNMHQGLSPRRKRGVAVTVVRCKECGLVFPDPMPGPLAVEDHYDLDPGAYWKDEYFQVSDDYFSGQIDAARSLLGRVDGLRALDVGAGIGKGMVALERAGFDAFGFEPSPAFREFGMARFGLGDGRFRLASVETVEYEQESFDFVNFGAVLEHFPDPSGALEKALGWLAPGGIFHVEVPSTRWLLSRGLNLVHRLKGTEYVTNLSPMLPPFHLYEFESRTFRRHSQRMGYDLVREDIYVGDVYAPGIVRPILHKLMQATGTGMQLAVWGRKRT
jgi:SAM-dependent methyltransferase